MATQLTSRRFATFVSVFAALPLLASAAWAQQAQLVDSQDQARDFHDEDGNVIVVGVLYEVTGNDVTIMADDATMQTFNINKFSDDDRVWIRKAVSDQKKFEKRKQAADKVIEELGSVQSSRIIKACRQLKSFGSAASHAGPKLVSLFRSQDDSVVLAAFVCYSNTAKRNKDSIDRMVRELIRPNSKVLRIVNERPEKFLDTLPRYEAVAIPYLRAVAYNCKLDTQPVKHSAVPEKLTLTSGTKNDLRVTACQTIAKIKLEVSSEILLQVLAVSDEGPKNQRDENTILKTIEAIGDLGIKTPEVIKALSRFETEFPDVVAEAIQKLG